MGELPSGTVTLLFSDMEGSTRMVHALGGRWAAVLDQQRDLCRAAWHAHGGVELGTEGDSFFVAFSSAHDAVAAAVAAQRSIAGATWPTDADVRVRIGVHTGSPQRHRDGYVGMDVHRAARVAAAAHGGQVLVSEPAWRAAERRLPESLEGRDLGEHRLKDIPSRTRLLQVVGAGLEASFPPVRSLGGAGNLRGRSVPPDGLVGRDGELTELLRLLAGGARLVTLTGPGGTGKTSLAAATAGARAEDHADGVFLVPMTTASSPDGMWAVLREALDLPPSGTARAAVLEHLAERRLLLVLDNLEQIDGAHVVVRDLLAEAPRLTLLATSRRPLHLPAEQEFALAPLRSEGAIELFARQASRVRRGFEITGANAEDVAEICRALDGLPLAIELAAARVKMLSPKAILARIDRSLDLASADRSRDPRQATVRGAIAWSYDLLDDVRRGVLDHLGIFAGSADVEAVEAVVPAAELEGAELVDVLFDLVDDSLVTVVEAEDGEPRFGLLETVRRFAVDRLSTTGRLEPARGAHAQFFYDLAARLDDEARASHRGTRTVFLRDLANFDAVLASGARGVRDPEHYDEFVPPTHVAALMARQAWNFHLSADARLWCELGLAQADGTSGHDRSARASLLRTLGTIDARAGALDAGLDELTRSWTELDLDSDASWEVRGPRWVDVGLTASHVAYELGATASDLDDPATADRWLVRLGALSDRLDPWSRQFVLELGSYVAAGRGDFDVACDYLERQGALLDELGVYRPVIANNIASARALAGDRGPAHRVLVAHLERVIDFGDPSQTIAMAETWAEAIGVDHPLLGARVLGSAAAARESEGLVIAPYERQAQDRLVAEVRALVDPSEWDLATMRGRGEDLVELLREVARLPYRPDSV